MKPSGFARIACPALIALGSLLPLPSAAAEAPTDGAGRVLVSMGGEVGGLCSPGIGSGGPGGFLEFGLQSNDRWGLGTELSGAALPGLTGYWRAALSVDFTPLDAMTVRLGPTYGGDFDTILPPGGPGAQVQSARFAGAMLELELHVNPMRTGPNRRSALTLALGFDLGETLADDGWSGPGGLSALSGGVHVRLGHAWY